MVSSSFSPRPLCSLEPSLLGPPPQKPTSALPRTRAAQCWASRKVTSSVCCSRGTTGGLGSSTGRRDGSPKLMSLWSLLGTQSMKKITQFLVKTQANRWIEYSLCCHGSVEALDSSDSAQLEGWYHLSYVRSSFTPEAALWVMPSLPLLSVFSRVRSLVHIREPWDGWLDICRGRCCHGDRKGRGVVAGVHRWPDWSVSLQLHPACRTRGKTFIITAVYFSFLLSCFYNILLFKTFWMMLM